MMTGVGSLTPKHHGLPTRFLDWSTSPLIALWFALGEFKEDGCELDSKDQGPCVWRLKADHNLWVDRKTNLFDTDDLCLFNPPYVSPRLRAQHGVFTVSGIKKYKGSLENVSRNEGSGKFSLELITFDPDSYENLANDLRHLGIDELSIYPDLHGVAQLLKRKAAKYANPTAPSLPPTDTTTPSMSGVPD